MAENGAVLHQAIPQKCPLPDKDLIPREEHISIGIDDTAGNRRFARVGTVSEQPEDHKTNQEYDHSSLDPNFGNQQGAFLVDGQGFLPNGVSRIRCFAGVADGGRQKNLAVRPGLDQDRHDPRPPLRQGSTCAEFRARKPT